MAREWTEEQLKAIKDKNSNILVSAAAGSGKTTVLVERMIRKIIDDGIDIDKILVVTFTNSAASEMRERILNALYEEIDNNPNDLRLRKQIVLLNKASICTIDSFCLDIIRNNFFEIGVSSNFRIADTNELELLKQEALETCLEKLYLEDNENINALVESYAGYKDDEDLKSLILKVYDFIQSCPFPEDWLQEKLKLLEQRENDFAKSLWGKILIKDFDDEIENCINTLKVAKAKVERWPELVKYNLILEDDIINLESLLPSTLSWDEKYNLAHGLKNSYKKWVGDKKINNQDKDEAKTVRDAVKERVKNKIDKTFNSNSNEAYQDIEDMYPIIKALVDIVLDFSEKYLELKNEKNVMDFSDIEHFALQILLRKDENGNYVKTEIAKKYEERFVEIAIDEYQDSNDVQESILKAVSNGNNIFMVGDVKQSIYKFRQARPELFIDKYEKYSLNTKNEYGEKIKLYKNFRSRKNILDITNLLFENIMSKDFGEIEYNNEEYLNYAATYFDKTKDVETIAELDIIDSKEKEASYLFEEDDKEDNESDLTQDEEPVEKAELEAKFVAQRIRKLIKDKYQVYDSEKETLRDVRYKDIVILMRATSNYSEIFEKELTKLEIPVFSDVAESYLDTIEIQTIINLLKIIDNPRRDIPLVTVMRSFIGGFTDNELLEIRLLSKDGLYYDALKMCISSNDIDEKLKVKVKNFLEKLDKWREEEKYIPLNDLIWKIYIETDYLNYVTLMPNGKIRKENLKMLFERAKEYEKVSFKGLFNFIRYLERIKSSNSDLSSAKLISENENVVRIMSIHKSKGLEFPITIISGADRKFNEKDFSEKLLLHHELGFGPQYINYKRQITYTTAAKEAVIIKAKDEMIAEEMRILYVALTRSKEKLIITGTEKDLNNKLEKQKEMLDIYEKENGKINHLILKKFKTYLGWLELNYLSQSKENPVISLNTVSPQEILKNDKPETKNEKQIDYSIIDTSKVNKILNWEYAYKNSTNIQSKMSVTKIKELKSLKTKDFKKEYIPNFMKEETITAAEKGTLMHLVLQKLDFKKNYSMSEIESFVNHLYEKGIINKLQKDNINIKKIYEIINSKFMNRVSKALEIHKEMPFYTYIPANEVYDIEEKENILVQGIMDLYFIDEAGKLVLVDYKTDYVQNKEELIEKYKVQLEIYKKALEESLAKKVDEVYLYSIFLNEELKVEFE